MEEPKSATSSKKSGLSVVRNQLESPEYGKLQPQAVDLEEAVLGALLLDKEALTDVIDILKKESFYKESHQLIFKAILELFERSEPIDILTVTQELKKQGNQAVMNHLQHWHLKLLQTHLLEDWHSSGCIQVNWMQVHMC